MPLATCNEHIRDAKTGKGVKFNKFQQVTIIDDDNPEDVCSLGKRANRSVCLFVSIQDEETGDGAHTKAMVDQGNLTKQGVVISERFLKRANYYLGRWSLVIVRGYGDDQSQ